MDLQANSNDARVVAVYLTRDCKHFRILKSPLSGIASRFFALLSGTSELSRAARRSFAHSVLDHPLPSSDGRPGDDDYTPTLDAQIQQLFGDAAPCIVLLQGAFKSDAVLDGAALATPGTVSSLGSLSGPQNVGPTSLADAVFAGYAIHNEYTRCLKEDRDHAARLAWYFLVVLAHESSHWLFTRIHGFRRDPLRPAQSGALPAEVSQVASDSSSTRGMGVSQLTEDPTITLGQNRDDCGARTTDALFGGTGVIVTFADGVSDIVIRKIHPPIHTSPALLNTRDIESLTGHKLSSLIDVTRQPPVIVSGPPPSWSTHDAYLVTSITVPNSFCQHGMCRIGSLF